MHNEFLICRFKDGAGPAMDLFLAKLRKPVCIVAHNGDRFDFPLLNKELAYAGQTFMDDILCCDSLKFFRASYSSSNKGIERMKLSNRWLCK